MNYTDSLDKKSSSLRLWLNKLECLSNGLYYKHVTIINYDASVISKWSFKLIDDPRVVIYNRHRFIIQATGQAFSPNLNIGKCWKKFYIIAFFLFSLFKIYQPSFILTGKARNLPLAHKVMYNLNDSAFTLKFNICLKRLARENTLAFSFSLSDKECLSATLSPEACIIKRFYCRTTPFLSVVS